MAFMKSHLSRRVLLGFLASVGVICALGIGSFFYILRVIDYSRMGGQSHQVLLLVEEVSTLTYKQAYYKEKLSKETDPKTAALNLQVQLRLRARLLALDSLVKNSVEQTALVGKLRSIATTVEESHVQSPATAMPLDSLAMVSAEMRRLELEARTNRQAMLTDQFYQFAFTFSALVIAGLVVPLTLAIALNKNLKKRSEYEYKLSAATRTVQDLYDSAPCGYFSLNQDGIFTHANKTLLHWLGYSEGEFVDRLHYKDVFRAGPEVLEKLQLTAGRQAEEFLSLEAGVVRKNGATVPVSINTSPVKDSQGRTISSRCTMFDLTELKRAEIEIRRANQELEAFSYSVSHDLRAPLRSINGFAKILLEDHSTQLDEAGQKYLSRISTNALLMTQLIEDLLNFARIGKQEMRKAEIDLDDFVKSTSQELVHQEMTRRIDINIQPLGYCSGDESMLRQAWINLISNAIKYSGKRDQAKIEIGKMSGGNETVFFIKDNGVGFDMRLSDRLFGVFQRLHKQEEFDGTGVGLALVKRIVERHNGRIWAESKPNEGATFYFTLATT